MVRILLHSADTVSEAMAGPAIRYWEIAKVLSKKHLVTLAIPNHSTLSHPDFRLISTRDVPLTQLAKQADVLITQYVNPVRLMSMKVKVILDLYDPLPLEALEIFKQEALAQRKSKNIHYTNRINLCARVADGFLCANKEQFNLWFGMLMSQLYITPERYDLSHTFEDYMGVVPFGLPASPPQKKGVSLREKYGFTKENKVLLWGGGIWNWFDPLTLIESIHLLSKTRKDIKLVFMGVKHPNPAIPAMSMAARAFELAKKYGLLDTHVFFNFEWIPYEERTGFLLDADIGVSTHSKHLETRFAFRTRILDYIWCELPILCTEGDSFAEIVKREKLGSVVPYQDAGALAASIEELLDNQALRKAAKANLARVRKEYAWEEVAKPIEQMIERLEKAPEKKVSLSQKLDIFWSFSKSYAKLKLS